MEIKPHDKNRFSVLQYIGQHKAVLLVLIAGLHASSFVVDQRIIETPVFAGLPHFYAIFYESLKEGAKFRGITAILAIYINGFLFGIAIFAPPSQLCFFVLLDHLPHPGTTIVITDGLITNFLIK